MHSLLRHFLHDLSVKQKILLLVAPFLFLIPPVLIAIRGLNDTTSKADIGVVLGNKVKKNGQPSKRLQGRLKKGIALYNGGCFPKIIVSGGTGKEGHNEALVMEKCLLKAGIPQDAIVIDTNAINTYGTARFAKQYLTSNNLGSAIVISQFYHTPRSEYAFRKFGIREVYRAHTDYFEPRDFLALFRESVAFIKYALLPYEI